MKWKDLVPWKSGSGKVPVDVKKGSSPVFALQQEVNSLFDRFFSGSPFEAFPLLSERAAGFSPKINVQDTNDRITVQVELPGLSEDDINLSLTEEYLTIEGEKRHETERSEGGTSYYEASYGSFKRVVPLDDAIDPDRVSANMKSGVLTIELPKREPTESSARTISISSEG